MRSMLALDLETTGLTDNPEATVTEVAYAIWDIEHRRVVKTKSYLVDITESDKKVPEDIELLTGISTALCKGWGYSHKFMVEDLEKQLRLCEAVMARNAQFDKAFVEREFEKAGVEVPQVPWICTKKDVDYPASVTGRSQGHVAADHGFVNPFPHWAIGDVLTMLRIHDIGGYGWETPLAMAKSPMMRVVAQVSFNDKDKAKEAGFSWEPEKKTWFKELRELRLDQERAEYNFQYFVEEM